MDHPSDNLALAEPPSGAHESAGPAQTTRPGPDPDRAVRGPLRWVFRIFRFEEAIILGMAAAFCLLFFTIAGVPGFERLWAGFTYNFHGRGTMWIFTLWVLLGSLFLMLVAALPITSGGRGRALMRGVWQDAQGFWARAQKTIHWCAGGLRAYLPFLVCMGIYEMLKRLIPAVRGDTLYDVEMAQFDIWLLGDLSAAMVRQAMHAEWITTFIGWFNLTQMDIHSTVYISYVYAAPALAISLWFLGRRKAFNRFIGALVICGALAYVGYVLVPVVGPKYVFGADRWLTGSGAALGWMDDIKGRSLDCFPSLHTAWTTLFLISAWRGCRPLFWVYLPIGIGVYIATLYGGYHYIPDLIAGHALAIFAWWAAKPLREWWDAKAGRAPAEDFAPAVNSR